MMIGEGTAVAPDDAVTASRALPVADRTGLG